MICNTCKNLLNTTDLKEDLYDYLVNGLINELYFIPKKISKDLINEKAKNSKYIDKVKRTIDFYKNIDIEKVILEKIHKYELDTSYKLDNYNIYVIIGLDTTTIYSTKYKGEDATVLLLESTEGNIDKLEMLLAHEYTHFVRKQIFKKDIFESSIGERLVVEGIGCNYSKEIVPYRKDYEYCIVNEDTVIWVKNNIEKVETHMKNKLNNNKLMRDYFYMYIDTKKAGMPARVGYVYGYLKVKEYLEKNNLKIKDIINKPWQDILNNSD